MAVELNWIGSFPRDQLALADHESLAFLALTEKCPHWQGNTCQDCKTCGWRITPNGKAILALLEFATWLQNTTAAGTPKHLNV